VSVACSECVLTLVWLPGAMPIGVRLLGQPLSARSFRRHGG
jgi:hypothetical protein